MQIDRSNYEIWIIDWLDGNLNELQVQQLKVFLNENHDLREEFNDLTQVKLVSPFSSFPYKEHLKKSPSDISQSQFEILCAAYLENDLTVGQQAELKEIVNTYPDRKKTFDQIQKTILAPERIIYKHKRLLRKRTTLQKVIRLSVIGLSTAAAISLIIIIYSSIPTTTSLKPDSSAHNFVTDSTLRRPSPVMADDRIIKESMPLPAEKKRENRLANTNKEVNAITTPDEVVSKAIILPPAPPSASSGQAQGGYRKMSKISKSPLGDLGVNLTGKAFETISSDDSTFRIIDKQELKVIKIPVYPQVDLGKGIVSNSLIASNPTFNVTDVEDERSRAGRFISKTFRQKFLKEKTPSDSPLKGYEIAEAGVTGLNKLFGWQMALDMKNDENGQPKSLYFSSKILKINAPIKKTEPQQ